MKAKAKIAAKWAWRLAKANAAGYAVMLLAWGILWALGMDGWLSFWLSRVPSWSVTVATFIIMR